MKVQLKSQNSMMSFGHCSWFISKELVITDYLCFLEKLVHNAGRYTVDRKFLPGPKIPHRRRVILLVSKHPNESLNPIHYYSNVDGNRKETLLSCVLPSQLLVTRTM